MSSWTVFALALVGVGGMVLGAAATYWKTAAGCSTDPADGAALPTAEVTSSLAAAPAPSVPALPTAGTEGVTPTDDMQDNPAGVLVVALDYLANAVVAAEYGDADTALWWENQVRHLFADNLTPADVIELLIRALVPDASDRAAALLDAPAGIEGR